jgi:glycosidase
MRPEISKKPQVLTLRLNRLEKNGTPPRTSPLGRRPSYAIHISRDARELYGIDDELFELNGNLILASFHEARRLAQRMNDKRDLVRFPEQAIRAGQINAMGLIDEILHYVATLYREQVDSHVFTKCLNHVEETAGRKQVDEILLLFVNRFPPKEVGTGKSKPREYLKGSTAGVPNREIALEELLHLWLANRNPGFEPCLELFDETEINQRTLYARVLREIGDFFKTQPGFGPGKHSLIELLLAPSQASPDDLAGQLRYIRTEWGMFLGRYLFKLLQSLDFIKEEEKPSFLGPGPARVYEYAGEEDSERFSMDVEWMPKVVLIAKSVYVWLHQLSTKYGRPVNRLDEIPGEELDTLAERGFTGLWLIGLWERSPASKRIKRMTGNPEAEASAYSLYEYEIAGDIGGWDALHKLKHDCNRRGIRLASDMVPNHTGIDSKWVINHPGWFIQLPYPPFPTYTYTGANLSGVPHIGLFVEDHYYDKTDAAVTFKREDYDTGDVRYIYHGNDGTSMPWNDTAQLNFLDAEVREAVIQTILHVTRNFSIVRFDAAMTLAKKHFHRLWFPEPGSGGDIASRAEHGMSREDFDRAMPKEFWREVVDRVAKEAPDTLLLAEAFWMMEGYFVRSLGMHRVYNSAFMNMLKAEENAKYRQTIKNTLEFEPEILKRFVNFMNNPDEDTAAQQFGKGDKYFGVCTLMATMPGLPMFGHGQVEGYSEKYGMEYRRAYWQEEEDRDLIDRHGREIFPLLKRRYLFADASRFRLYDLHDPEGGVNENVFAYSNAAGSERSLVLYNNSYGRAKGWIKRSTEVARKGSGGEKKLETVTLAEALGLKTDADAYTLLKDQPRGLWYVRSSRELAERGLYVELDGYETHVFTDIYEVADNDLGHYGMLEKSLAGKGTPSVDDALKDIFLRPVHEAFRIAVDAQTVLKLVDALECRSLLTEAEIEELAGTYETFVGEAFSFTGVEPPIPDVVTDMRSKLEAILTFSVECGLDEPKLKHGLPEQLTAGFKTYRHSLPALALYPFAALTSGEDGSMYWDLRLETVIRKILTELDYTPADTADVLRLLRLLILLETTITLKDVETPGKTMTKLFGLQEIGSFLAENRWEGVLYFNKERFEELIWIVELSLAFRITSSLPQGRERSRALGNLAKRREEWIRAEKNSGYGTERFLELLGDDRR